jgi:hypothetical protein
VPDGIRSSVIAALVIAAVSTLGDFIWVALGLRHLPSYGLTHGTLLFLSIGLVLGAFARRFVIGGIAGAAIGFLAAGSFYVLSPIAGFMVMFAIWPALWIALGIFNDFLNRHGRPLAAINRGLAGAVLSGIAFYLVSGIWFPFDPEGWDYLVHLGAWTLAFLPGFGALLIAQNDRRSLAWALDETD